MQITAESSSNDFITWLTTERRDFKLVTAKPVEIHHISLSDELMLNCSDGEELAAKTSWSFLSMTMDTKFKYSVKEAYHLHFENNCNKGLTAVNLNHFTFKKS